MKKLFFVFLTLAIAFAGTMNEAPMQIGLQGNVNYYFAFMDDNDNSGIFSPGVEGFFDMKLNEKLALNISAGYNQIKIDYPTVLTNNLLNLNLRAKYFLFKTEKFSPFVSVGAGVFSFSQDNGTFDGNHTTTQLMGGAGVEIPISNKFNLIPSLSYNITQDDLDHLPNFQYWLDDEYMTVSIGISYKLGGTKEEPVLPEPIKVEKPVEPVKEEVVEETETIVEATPVVEEVQEVEEVAEVEEVVTPAVYETMEYMIKRGDNLSFIAQKAFGSASKWNEIYEWNKDRIGSNPNLIYPFHQLQLQNVSSERMTDLTYTLNEYEVQAGETLRSIAANKYGCSDAWIVIMRDNQDVLGGSRVVSPGTVLKIRDNLLNK